MYHGQQTCGGLAARNGAPRPPVKRPQILEHLVRETGLSISGVVKRGLPPLQDHLAKKEPVDAWEIYLQIDLGPGGYAIASATESGRAVKEAIRRKHRR